jgi:hypothetical protein
MTLQVWLVEKHTPIRAAAMKKLGIFAKDESMIERTVALRVALDQVPGHHVGWCHPKSSSKDIAWWWLF